jgi:hypothetical protein
MGRLKETVERAMRAVPVYDKEGKPTGEYTFQGAVSNKALELLGRELGMFRASGDEPNPVMLGALTDCPPKETREQWIATTRRERGLLAIVGPAAGAKKIRDND